MLIILKAFVSHHIKVCLTQKFNEWTTKLIHKYWKKKNDHILIRYFDS